MTRQSKTQSKNRTFTTVVSVDASIEALWTLTIDVAKLPTITDRFKRLELISDEPLEVGSHVRIWQPRALSQVWTIETMVEPSLFVWSTRVGPVKLLGVHELSPTGTAECELRLRLTMSGHGAGLMAKLMGKRVQASIDREAADFAAFVRLHKGR